MVSTSSTTDATRAPHDAVLAWFATHARDLPWRRPECSAWGVLVSEVMLQQTPVARVLPVWQEWMDRWPEPADLAAEPSGEAVRAWGRLGYPRRALRLHAAAQFIVEHHDALMPHTYDELIQLPGVGDYTAAAVASFAFGQRHVVLDTNVRRVLVRAFVGDEFPASSVTKAERVVAESLLPDDEATAARWNAAVMEIGALVCTASNPSCDACPLKDTCAWVAAGRPAYDGPPRKGQAWHGTDRQCRGRLLAVLRDAEGAVPLPRLEELWPQDAEQRERALAGLLADGLAEEVAPGWYALPGW